MKSKLAIIINQRKHSETMTTPIPVTLKRPTAPIKSAIVLGMIEPMTSRNLDMTDFKFMEVKPEVSCPRCNREVEHPDWCPCIQDQEQDERLQALFGASYMSHNTTRTLEERIAALKVEPLPRAVETTPLCNLCLNSNIACTCYLCQRCGVQVKYKTGELPLCVLCMLVCHVNGCCKQCFHDKCDGSCRSVKRAKHSVLSPFRK